MIKVNIFYFVVTLFLFSCTNNNDKIIQEKVKKKLQIQLEIDQNKKMIQKLISKNNSDNNINKSIDEDNLKHEQQHIQDSKSIESENIDQYIKGRVNFNDIMSEAFTTAKNRYLYYGDGNFKVLRNEIINQYPRRIEEVQYYYMINKTSMTNKQINDLSDLVEKMKNLFDNAFRS